MVSFEKVLVSLLICSVFVVLMLCEVVLMVSFFVVMFLMFIRLSRMGFSVVLRMFVRMIRIVVSDGNFLSCLLIFMVIGVVIDFGVSDISVFWLVLKNVVMLIVVVVVVIDLVNRLVRIVIDECFICLSWW